MIFPRSLRTKSPQVSRTLLCILADVNNAVVWMASTCLFISKFSSPCTNPLVTAPWEPIIIGINVTFMFHSFSVPLQGPGSYSSFHFLSILLCSLLLFLLIIIRSGRLDKIRCSVCFSKSQRSLYISFFWRDSGLCICHLFIWSNLNFLHNSEWIALPTQLCLVLYSFCASLLHSLIMWLIISSLSLDKLHLLFCCLIYSCFDMVGPYGVILCCY